MIFVSVFVTLKVHFFMYRTVCCSFTIVNYLFVKICLTIVSYNHYLSNCYYIFVPLINSYLYIEAFASSLTFRIHASHNCLVGEH